jgi:abequosyltransferase
VCLRTKFGKVKVMNNIKLSICIPTYNRAEYLNITLQSIVSQQVFQTTSDVEIVISDNCSVDNTREIVDTYIKQFGDKIIYHRNKENIVDKNFEMVLSKGNGLYLKLNNDTLTHTQNTLNCILCDVNNSLVSKNILFFLNQGLDQHDSMLCNNLNEFIDRAAYFGTWIGSFGIWKDDFEKLDNFSRHAKLLLTQTDVLYRMIDKRNKVYVNNDLIFISQDAQIKQKGGYDLLTVFLENHTYILKEYLNENKITKQTFNSFTIKLLLIFFRKYLVLSSLYPDKFNFKTPSKFSRIIKFYKPRYTLLLKFFITFFIYYLLKFARN